MQIDKVAWDIEQLKEQNDIKVEIIGTWIWVSGKTYPLYDKLKELNFNWSKSKKAWFWNNGKGKQRFNAWAKDLNEIRAKYGSTEV